MTSDPDNALILEAFHYLCGEMSSAERNDFERLLSEGGLACDALADAVVLQQAVLATQTARSSVKTSVAPKRQSVQPARSSWKVWVSGSLLAALALGLLVLRSDPQSTMHGTDNVSQDQLASVAEAWSNLSSTAPEITGEAMSGDVDAEYDGADWSVAPVNVPEWMYAAVDASQMSEEAEIIPESPDENAL